MKFNKVENPFRVSESRGKPTKLLRMFEEFSKSDMQEVEVTWDNGEYCTPESACNTIKRGIVRWHVPYKCFVHHKRVYLVKPDSIMYPR